MSKKSEFIKKLNEKNAAELEEQARELRADIEKREVMRHFAQAKYNVHELSDIKRNLARILTRLNQLTMEQQGEPKVEVKS